MTGRSLIGRKTAMLNPYTMEKLNAERLKDLDREAVGLRYSMLARRNRRRIYHAALVRLGNLLIAAGKLVKQRGDKCIAGCGVKKPSNCRTMP